MDEEKKVYRRSEAPICYEVKMDCHSYDRGVCMLLENTRFRRGYCPFYKSKEQSELDRKKSEKRLIKLGYIKPKKKRKQPTEKKDGEVINGEGIHGDQGKNPAEGQSE